MGQPVRRPLPAAGLAVLAVYLPTITPFVVGPLTGCDHCVATYLKLVAVAPGLLLGFLVGGSETTGLVVAGVVTLALLLGAFVCARRLPTRDLVAAFVVLAVPVAIECHFVGIALRA